MDVFASYVSKSESGKRRIDVEALAEFCRTYGVGIVELLKAAGLT